LGNLNVQVTSYKLQVTSYKLQGTSYELQAGSRGTSRGSRRREPACPGSPPPTAAPSWAPAGRKRRCSSHAHPTRYQIVLSRQRVTSYRAPTWRAEEALLPCASCALYSVTRQNASLTKNIGLPAACDFVAFDGLLVTCNL